jgi:hypothetical protein
LQRKLVADPRVGESGGALQVDYDLSAGDFAFRFESLWSDRSLARNYLDRDDFFRELALSAVRLDRLRLWVHGGTSYAQSLKVELKDESETAAVHRYVEVPPETEGWHELSLPLDVTDAASWQGATGTINPRRLEQLAFVVEKSGNPQARGRFFLDEVAFVDDDAVPLRSDAGNRDLLELVGLRAFQYFLDWYDPETGLWQDRSEFPDLFSTAATGFGLSALAVGEARGWIARDLAVARVKNTLRRLRDGQQAGSPAQSKTQNGYRGFYYHFLDKGGRRKDAGSELSSVDTALLMMGVLHVREHFAGDEEIVALADAVYQRVEWRWMLSATRQGLFHQAWSPDCGGDYTVPASGGGCFKPGLWDYTTDEVILIDLLAIGSPVPAHRVSADAFYAWARERGGYGGHEPVRTWFGSLFTYFFAHQWIDFGPLGRDGHPDPAKRVDWQQNAIAAALANRQFVIDEGEKDPDRYPAYGPDSWGLTAAEAPGRRVHAACSDGEPSYCSYGAPPAGTTPFHDGTIAPYGAAAVTMLLGDVSIDALRHYRFSPDLDLWRERFGLADAYNLNPLGGYAGSGSSEPWYDRVLFGIDEGPLLLGIDNHLGGTTRAEVMRNPYIRDALCRVFVGSAFCRPSAPVLSGTDPRSPANHNAPKVKGSAAAGTTVRLFTNAACSGDPVAEGSAADFFAPGLTISVADDSVTTLYATATDEVRNVSACSPGSIIYIEDSSIHGVLKARKVQRPLKQKGITLLVECPAEEATVETGGSVRVPAAGKVKRLRLPRVTTSLSRGERARLKLPLSRSVRRDIRRAFRNRHTRKRVKAIVRATFTDTARNTDTERAPAVRLKR